MENGDMHFIVSNTAAFLCPTARLKVIHSAAVGVFLVAKTRGSSKKRTQKQQGRLFETLLAGRR
jgi:hypothetical protein